MIVLREIAAAKINLYLHVTGKRADGFHELDSWVVFAEAGDVLEVAKADTLTFTVHGRYATGVPPDDNSVLAAAHLLRAHFDIEAGAEMTLTKRLPVAAGIGGGTADAAAALKLLVRLWGIAADDKELMKLAGKLGSDVPACMRSQSLYMNGRGEKITSGPQISGWHAVLANPGVPLSTKEVFAVYDRHYSSAMRHPKEFVGPEAAVQFLKGARNDLQAAATERVPVIADVLAALDVQEGCLLARMSGSGATCFGIYNGREAAQNAAARLAEAYPEWWVQETTLR